MGLIDMMYTGAYLYRHNQILIVLYKTVQNVYIPQEIKILICHTTGKHLIKLIFILQPSGPIELCYNIS